MLGCVGDRKTRGGWPLLTVETEVNGDSQSTNERGHSLFGSLGLLCRFREIDFCPALATLVDPLQDIFFLTVHNFYPAPSKEGRQSCWVACLLVCVSGLRP